MIVSKYLEYKLLFITIFSCFEVLIIPATHKVGWDNHESFLIYYIILFIKPFTICRCAI